MLASLCLHMKSGRVCIKTRSTPASLPLKGQVTKHTTVKWAINNVKIVWPRWLMVKMVIHEVWLPLNFRSNSIQLSLCSQTWTTTMLNLFGRHVPRRWICLAGTCNSVEFVWPARATVLNLFGRHVQQCWICLAVTCNSVEFVWPARATMLIMHVQETLIYILQQHSTSFNRVAKRVQQV